MSTKNNRNTQVMMLAEAQNMKNTTKKRTEAFNGWVALKIKALERTLFTDMQVMNCWLFDGQLAHEKVFESMFEYIYVSINAFADEINKVGIDANLPVSVLRESLSDLKSIKLKVRRIKSEYKKMFSDLRKKIYESKQDADYVKATSDLITDTTHKWSGVHRIRCYWEDKFVKENCGDTVAMFTNAMLSKKLHPSEDEVRKYVERNMKQYSLDEEKVFQN